MEESVVALRIENEQALIQENIDRDFAGALDHEFSSRLAQDRRRVVNELPGLRFDAQIDASLDVHSPGWFRNRRDGGIRSCGRGASFCHEVILKRRMYVVNTASGAGASLASLSEQPVHGGAELRHAGAGA